MLLGEGAYGKVNKIKVNDTYFALKETVLPEYPKEVEVIMACLREEAMHLVHPHIIERKWCRFVNNKPLKSKGKRTTAVRDTPCHGAPSAGWRWWKVHPRA